MSNHKTSGGNTMSKTTAARRIALLASSSLGLAAIASAAVVLVPATSHAANECAPVGVAPSANAGPDTYVCNAALYASGITYSASGDLTITATPPVNSSFGEPYLSVATAGVNLSATGGDSLSWNSSTGIVSGTAGPILEALTEGGDISLTLKNVADWSFSSAAVTHGVRAISTNGGDITVGVSGYVGSSLSSGGIYGLEARSTGGDGNILVNLTGTLDGWAAGLFTSTVGATGDTTINVNGTMSGGLEAESGSGALTINVGTSGFFRDDYGPTTALITTRAGGAAAINIASGARQFGFMDLTAAAGTTTTINNLGSLGDTSNWRNLIIQRAAGAGRIVVNNSSVLGGAFNLSGSTGGSAIGIGAGARWRTNANSTFGSGADTLSVAATGMLGTGSGSQASSGPTEPVITMDFGGGTNVFANAGVLLIGVAGPSSNGTNGQAANHGAELRLLNLTQINNSGTILLGGHATNSSTAPLTIYAHERGPLVVGSFTADDPDLVQATDQWFDDILAMPGATFTGAPGSRIVFDVNLMASGQSACTNTRREASGDMAADCVNIAGGTTAGTTLVAIHDTLGAYRGIYNPQGTVLIDVSGGTSAAEHFTIDPLSDSYSAAFGGVIDKGIFFYPLIYDEDAQQHKLTGLVSGDGAQFPLLADAAHSLWRVSTGSWLERQADLRGGLDAPGGVWLRINSEFADRKGRYSTGAFGTTFDFDTSYDQTSYALTGGADLIVGGAGDTAFVLGLTAGYSHADVEFDASPNTAEFDGWTGGVYASLVSGGLFVDAIVNANKADMKDDIPALNLFPAGTILDTHLLSVGGQVEAGWRIPMADGVFVEPLASLAYVRTTYDDLEAPAGDPAAARIGIEFDDPTSLRASLGGRAGLERDFGGARVQVSGLLRVWNEFEGETAVTLWNDGADPVVTSDFSGQFTELGLGASVYSAGGLVSGFLNLGGKFGDDYRATTASAGIRVSW